MKNSDMPVSLNVIVCGDVSVEEVSSALKNMPKGLTKREHFAAMAMQGLLSNSSTGDSTLWDSSEEWVRQMSECAVEFADATLAELEK